MSFNNGISVPGGKAKVVLEIDSLHLIAVVGRSWFFGYAVEREMQMRWDRMRSIPTSMQVWNACTLDYRLEWSQDKHSCDSTATQHCRHRDGGCMSIHRGRSSTEAQPSSSYN